MFVQINRISFKNKDLFARKPLFVEIVDLEDGNFEISYPSLGITVHSDSIDCAKNEFLRAYCSYGQNM